MVSGSAVLLITRVLTAITSEFNYIRNDDGECVLLSGLSPREADANGQCREGDKWYDLTPYRKIPYSSCEGGTRLDRGKEHDNCENPHRASVRYAAWLLP